MVPYALLDEGLVPRWEQAWEGRFAHEMVDLERVVGNSLKVDPDALRAGHLRVRFTWPRDGHDPCELEADYPDSFPFLMPRVRLLAKQEKMPERHCSPIDGTLCLLGRDTHQWRATWTLAHLLSENLEKALMGSDNEDPQGEPIEVWWNHLAQGAEGTDEESYVLVDSDWELGEVECGTAVIRFVVRRTESGLSFKGAVDEVRSRDGAVLAAREFPLPPDLASGSPRTAEFEWRRVNRLLPPTSEMCRDPSVIESIFFSRKTDGNSNPTLSLSITVQSTELSHGVIGDAWLFALRHGPARTFRTPRPGKPASRPSHAILTTLRAGPSDIGGRVPSVGLLREKTVAVIGCGSIGAPIALEFAKGGCRTLILLDHDTIEPGNAIRWPLGTSAWGRKKVTVLKEFIESEYPGTKVITYDHYLGAPTVGPGARGDGDVLPEVIGPSDVVIDATASWGVTRMLAHECRQPGRVLVSAAGTPSLKGGSVTAYRPGSACPACREWAYESGLLEKAPGSGDDSELIQPAACAERTFPGASFDLADLSNEAVRMALGVLQEPDALQETKVHTLSLHDGRCRIPPSWRVDRVPAMSECGCLP